MKPVKEAQVRKRAVNLTLSADLVSQARDLTPNLSAVVEQLLADYVMQQRNARDEKSLKADAVSKAWNAFNEKYGSFADEHSTL